MTLSGLGPAMAPPCQGCSSSDVSVFYSGGSSPVQSCVLLHSPDVARRYPKGEITLGFCRSCGLIQNTSFVPDLVDYSRPAEESQVFSPVFRAFVRQLAASLINRHGLEGKKVVEIGSGRGDFLELLSELGHTTGVGIDPGFMPERLQDQVEGSLRFIPEYFSESHVGLPADLICCRHVLEHVWGVGDFLARTRRMAAAAGGPVVFFEVPDGRRVMLEGAFWDVYYEHCSYFSPGTLARLFRAEGLGVSSLSLGYQMQYILLEGMGANAQSESVAQDAAFVRVDEESIDDLSREVEHFSHAAAEKKRYWRDLLTDLHDKGMKVAVWGGGSKAVAFLAHLAAQELVGAVVDINPHKQGLYLPGSGHEVVAPDALVTFSPDAVIVMNPVYLDEIHCWLDGRGIHARLHALA